MRTETLEPRLKIGACERPPRGWTSAQVEADLSLLARVRESIEADRARERGE